MLKKVEKPNCTSLLYQRDDWDQEGKQMKLIIQTMLST